MKLIEGLERIRRMDRPVVTIGNFDGIHIGHQRIIEEVRRKAAEIDGVSALITFDPHPLSLLKPENLEGLITPLPVKKRILEEMGIDVLIILKFEESFRGLEPEDFIRDVLVKRIGVSVLVLGYDFRFGKDAKGDVNLIEKLSEKYGFLFRKIDPVTLDGEKVGSNRIRKMIVDGDLLRVRDFLGRTFSVTGKVIYGAGLGKKIGFPTANLAFSENQLLPKKGVYITEVELHGNYYPSVTNIGFKPTLNLERISVETHILDFHKDIYGMEIEVKFYERIRDEMKFGSLEELRSAIAEDVKKARAFFKDRL